MTRRKEGPSTEFAQRLERLCESNPQIPPWNYGRLEWFCRRLEEDFGTKVTRESVRRWFSGESTPRLDKVEKIASILGVEPQYLLLGVEHTASPAAIIVADSAHKGMMSVVAGFIQMSGGSVEFPSGSEDIGGPVNLIATIKRAKYHVYISLGELQADTWKFHVPERAVDESIFVIGAARLSEFICEFFELDADKIKSRGSRVDGYFAVAVPVDHSDPSWKRIDSFSNRL